MTYPEEEPDSSEISSGLRSQSKARSWMGSRASITVAQEGEVSAETVNVFPVAAPAVAGGLEIFLLPLRREGSFTSGVEKSRYREGSLGLVEEISNVIGHGLLFYGGEVKVCSPRKDFLGNAEHQLTQRGGEEGCMEGILTFWHDRHLPSR